jgi:hypothetical protein
MEKLKCTDLHLEHISGRLATKHGIVQDNLTQQAEVRLMTGQREQDEVCIEPIQAMLGIRIASI